MGVVKDNRELVERYLTAFFANPLNIDEIQNVLHDECKFRGPLMTADSADEYLEKLRAFGPIQLKADIHHLLIDGNGAGVLFSFIMPSGNHAASEWYTFRDGKIASIQLCNDPRPFLEVFSTR